ncbi:testis-expressed protein 264 [Pagrus major]|uniref:testis-expressed protein 264 n=1 Tax=Pagrus major TaxID=143350 RepID=UPI003CC8916A
MAAWLFSGLSLGVVTTVITVSYLLYSGLLTHVTVATGPPPIKKVTIAYKFRRGPYRNCWSLYVETSKIGPGLPQIGLFYDDPNKIPEPHCRYAVGSILSEEENEVDEEVLKRYETAGYKVFSFPEVTHAVTASFPYRTLLSIFLRLIKVVRPLQRHMLENKKKPAFPLIEIYKDNLIQFMVPLNEHNKFGVPEVWHGTVISGDLLPPLW